MLSIIFRIALIVALFSTLSLATQMPSDAALTSALKSIGSEESYSEIGALSTLKEQYRTQYNSHLRRHQATQKEYEVVERQFREAGVPTFFSLIPYCESGFRTNSHGYGTAGLWQFMAQSGRNNGLTVEKGRDDRTDACLSTEAAIRYVKRLKKEFGSWYLADFAYGMGELKVQRMIQKNGSKKISVLLRDPEFSRGTRDHFSITLLLAATIHPSKGENEDSEALSEDHNQTGKTVAIDEPENATYVSTRTHHHTKKHVTNKKHKNKHDKKEKKNKHDKKGKKNKSDKKHKKNKKGKKSKKHT
jgi:membrane-bound lytic murein transglycosylase D